MQTSTQAVRARTDEPFLERFIEAHEAFVLRCASRYAGFAVTRSASPLTPPTGYNPGFLRAATCLSPSFLASLGTSVSPIVSNNKHWT